MSDEGLKNLAHSDYLNKFKDVLWTSDLTRESFPSGLLYGSEIPLTITQNFFKQVEVHKHEVCMQMKRKVEGTDSKYVIV